MYVTKKDMCFVRKLDDIGRITIPRDVRNIYNLSPRRFRRNTLRRK